MGRATESAGSARGGSSAIGCRTRRQCVPNDDVISTLNRRTSTGTERSSRRATSYELRATSYELRGARARRRADVAAETGRQGDGEEDVAAGQVVLRPALRLEVPSRQHCTVTHPSLHQRHTFIKDASQMSHTVVTPPTPSPRPLVPTEHEHDQAYR